MNMKKTSNELLTEILEVLNEINEKIGMTAKDKAEIIDEKIKDEVREQQIAEDFKF